MVTWKFYNGVEKTVVPGMYVRVMPPQKVVTLKFCNGVDKMVVHGMEVRVMLQQEAVTWNC